MGITIRGPQAVSPGEYKSENCISTQRVERGGPSEYPGSKFGSTYCDRVTREVENTSGTWNRGRATEEANGGLEQRVIRATKLDGTLFRGRGRLGSRWSRP